VIYEWAFWVCGDMAEVVGRLHKLVVVGVADVESGYTMEVEEVD
jgi:hypothetical protein